MMASSRCRQCAMRIWIVSVLMVVSIFIGREITMVTTQADDNEEPRTRLTKCNCVVCVELQRLYSLPYNVIGQSGNCDCDVCMTMISEMTVSDGSSSSWTIVSDSYDDNDDQETFWKPAGHVYLDAGVNIDMDVPPPDTASDKYSSIRCTGGTGIRNEVTRRVCIARNVCHFSGRPNVFTFFSNPHEPPSPLYFDDNDILSRADHSVGMRGTYSFTHAWEFETVDEPMPANATFHPVKRAVAGHYQGGNMMGLNFGHFMCDAMWPAYVSQLAVGLQPSDDILLVDSLPADHHYPKFKKFWGLAEGLSRHPHIPDLDLEEDVCFKEVILGWGSLSCMHATEIVSLTAEPFRDYMLKNLGIQYPSQRKHKIVLLSKSRNEQFGQSAARGRHVLNEGVVVALLKAVFEEKLGIPVMIVEPDKLSIREQLELAASTTVMITPPGGGSYLAWFLQPGASAIFLDIWGLLEGNLGQHFSAYSVRYALDDNLWSRLNYITDLHYPVCDASEMWGGSMDTAEYIVVPPRIAYMVWLALREVESRIPESVLPRVALPELLPEYSVPGVVCSIGPNTTIFKDF